MANTAFFIASVGAALKRLQLFKSYPKVGKVTFAFLSMGQRDNAGVVSGVQTKFRISESSDGVTWTTISGAGDIVVGAGSQKVVTVISNKSFLRLEGKGEEGTGAIGTGTANKGGSVKVDVTHNGIQYYGQLDPDASNGKTGYGKEGDAYSITNGAGNLSATAWGELEG